MSKIILGPGDRATKGKTPYSKNNPLTKTGREVMVSMKKKYGAQKGEKVFYATMNKYNKKWH